MDTMDQTDRIFISSDERVKGCICPLNGLLCKLDQIDFVSYDRIGKNTYKQEVGIIAQNVIKVFPEMVNFTTNYLPNIQKKAEHTLMANDIVFIRLENALPVKENDNGLFIITHPGGRTKDNHTTTIINATEVSIEIKKWVEYSPSDELFVYGTMVEDYHSIDVTQIGVLGAACAKELYHMVKCQAETIAALKKQIDDLAARLS